MLTTIKSLTDISTQFLVNQIKMLPPVLLENIIGIVKKQVIEEITEEVTEQVYQKIETELPVILKTETHRVHSNYTCPCTHPPEANNRIILLGQELVRMCVEQKYFQPSWDEESDSEGSSGDYDYPEENYC